MTDEPNLSPRQSNSDDAAELRKRLDRIEAVVRAAAPSRRTLYTALAEVARMPAEIERLRAEHQAVIDCVYVYGDETLHQALDAIGWPRG